DDHRTTSVVRHRDASPGERLARVHLAIPVHVAVDGPSDRLRRRDEGDVEARRTGQGHAGEVSARLVERLDVVRSDGEERKASPDEVGLEPYLAGRVREGDRRRRIPDGRVRVAHRAAKTDALDE